MHNNFTMFYGFITNFAKIVDTPFWDDYNGDKVLT